MTATTSTRAANAPSAAPIAPPRSWFADPKLTGLTPLTVEPSGRVFGHLASWKECHLESAALGRQCVTAPRSRTGYSRFMLGAVLTAEGSTVATGPIVMGAPHADSAWSLAAALDHYGNSARAVADVRVGEDRFGIWIAGALRPTVTPAQVRELRASPLSGDWRTYSGHLELVAALAVNSPGFAIQRPQARALIASVGASAGAVRSAVGIGAVPQRHRSIVSDPRAFELAALAAEVEAVRRSPFALSTREREKLDVLAFGERRRAQLAASRRAWAAELPRLAAQVRSGHELALVASMGAPTAKTQGWEGPLGFENLLTGDGRVISSDALDWATMPLPLRYAAADFGGHDGAVVVGRIDSIERQPNGAIFARGVLDLGSDVGQEVARLIAGGYLGGVSLDLDSVDAAAGQLSDGSPASVVSDGRVRAATIVAVPAFEGARIALVGPPTGGSIAPQAAADAPNDDPDCGCDPAPAQAAAPSAKPTAATTGPGSLPDLSDTRRFPPIEDLPSLDAFPGTGPYPKTPSARSTK